MTNLHLPWIERNLIGYGRNVPQVIWPNNARVAVSIVLNYEEGSERSWASGDNYNEGLGEIPRSIDPRFRDLAIESTYEYGSRVGAYRVFRLLDKYNIKCTVHAAAIALEKNPEVAEYIREAGHEPCAHGWRWSEDWNLSREDQKRRIELAIESITRTCGERPVGWYSRYMPSIHTRELLIENGGFLYDSDAYNDDLPYYVKADDRAHLVLPYSFTYSDTRFVYGQYASPADFFDDCRRGFDYLWEEGETHPKMMSIGLHPRLIGQASRTSAIRDFIEYALNKGDVWFARRKDIAHWWVDHFPPTLSKIK